MESVVKAFFLLPRDRICGRDKLYVPLCKYSLFQTYKMHHSQTCFVSADLAAQSVQKLANPFSAASKLQLVISRIEHQLPQYASLAAPIYRRRCCGVGDSPVCDQ